MWPGSVELAMFALQVFPPSTLRKMPPCSVPTNTRRGSAGAIAIAEIGRRSRGGDTGDHVVPSGVVRQTRDEPVKTGVRVVGPSAMYAIEIAFLSSCRARGQPRLD